MQKYNDNSRTYLIKYDNISSTILNHHIIFNLLPLNKYHKSRRACQIKMICEVKHPTHIHRYIDMEENTTIGNIAWLLLVKHEQNLA